MLFMAASVAWLAFSCDRQVKRKFDGTPGEVKIMTLDPGHFHAALVQKIMYPQVDSDVHVFAPQGEDLLMHLKRIQGFNTRTENPTHWNEIIYESEDYFQKMLELSPGNVVMLAGNNGLKMGYIRGSIEAGLNVYADKPMAIDREGYGMLLEAFDKAEKKGVLLYDIMTERYEITNALQIELARIPELFGEPEEGTLEEPAIINESVHHFFKYVSGAPNIRPEWFFDVKQQGEGIVDVTTHLVDLIQLTVVGENPIDINKQVALTGAKRWPTAITPSQWQLVTGRQAYPDYLSGHVADGALQVYANGQIDFTLNGVNCRAVVRWNFVAPEGTGDSHYVLVRGTKADISIRQTAAEGYKPQIYISRKEGVLEEVFANTLKESVARLAEKYPGLEVEQADAGWRLVIPSSYDVGHEAHFGQVTEKYLRFLIDGKLPAWEVANMKSKYFITTSALEKALGGE